MSFQYLFTWKWNSGNKGRKTKIFNRMIITEYWISLNRGEYNKICNRKDRDFMCVVENERNIQQWCVKIFYETLNVLYVVFFIFYIFFIQSLLNFSHWNDCAVAFFIKIQINMYVVEAKGDNSIPVRCRV